MTQQVQYLLAKLVNETPLHKVSKFLAKIQNIIRLTSSVLWQVCVCVRHDSTYTHSHIHTILACPLHCQLLGHAD